MGRAEVGPIPTEHEHPLLASVVEILGNKVRGVGVAAAGHGDISRRSTGVFAQHQMGRTGGFTLGAVDG